VVLITLFLFPLCAAICPIYGGLCLLPAIATCAVASIYEEYVNAKSTRGVVETLYTALGEARQRIAAFEDENKALDGLQDCFINIEPEPNTTSEEFLAVCRDNIAAVQNETDEPDGRLLPDEPRTWNENSPSNLDLNTSLDHTTRDIAKLDVCLAQMKEEQHITTVRIQELERENCVLQQEFQNSCEEHVHTLNILERFLRATEQLTDRTGSPNKKESEPSEANHSPTTILAEFRFPLPPSTDAVDLQDGLRPNTASTVSQDFTATRDVAHASAFPNKNNVPPQEAPCIETIIRRRVYKKVELAFDVCRKQGRFGNVECDEPGTEDGVENQADMHSEKMRLDSLTAVQDVLKDMAKEKREKRRRDGRAE
jgi:hypothetical protein